MLGEVEGRILEGLWAHMAAIPRGRVAGCVPRWGKKGCVGHGCVCCQVTLAKLT